MIKTKLIEKWEGHLRLNPRTLALPELMDPRVMLAGQELIRSEVVARIVTCSLRGSFERTVKALKDAGWTSSECDRVTSLEVEVDVEKDRESFLRNSLHRLASELQNQKVDAILAGAELTTADVARCAIKQIGMKQGIKTLSSGFLLEGPRHALYFSDCGIVLDPTLSQLQEIAVGALNVYRNLTGNESPTVAFLSFSSMGSAVTASSQKMSEAAANFAKSFPDLPVVGEVQFDAAWDPKVYERKRRSKDVAVVPKLPADIFIFPEINSANISYKIVQRVAGFHAYGPILQGTKRPICDLSRGSTAEDIYATALIALLQIT